MELHISPIGSLSCIYSEAIDLSSLGLLQIERASFVEPDASGQWFADLSPVQGPSLGPFPLRSEALAAEERWLNVHWLTRLVASPP